MRLKRPTYHASASQLKELAEAMRAEENPKVKNRMRAVRIVLSGKTTEQAAEQAGVSDGAVAGWMEKYQRKGTAGLQTAKNQPIISAEIFAKEAKLLEKQDRLTPKTLRERLAEKTGYKYSRTGTMRLLNNLGYETTAPKAGHYSRHAHWPWKMVENPKRR